jgi:hypothetical protein
METIVYIYPCVCLDVVSTLIYFVGVNLRRQATSRYLRLTLGLGAAAVAAASTRWTRIAVEPELALGLLDPPAMGSIGLGRYVAYVAAAAAAAIAATVRPSRTSATVWLGIQGALLAMSLSIWVTVRNDVAFINQGPGPDAASVGGGVPALLGAALVGAAVATSARRWVTGPRRDATASIPTLHPR